MAHQVTNIGTHTTIHGIDIASIKHYGTLSKNSGATIRNEWRLFSGYDIPEAMASLSPSKLVDILGVRFGKELRAIDNSEVIKKWNDAKMESVASGELPPSTKLHDTKLEGLVGYGNQFTVLGKNPLVLYAIKFDKDNRHGWVIHEFIRK